MARSDLPAEAAPALAGPCDRDKFSYLAVYQASEPERIAMAVAGVCAIEAKRIASEFDLGQGAILWALKLSPVDIHKMAKQDLRLTPEDGARVLGFASIVGQLEALVQECGDPRRFDLPAWISRWLADPVPALGGARPLDLIESLESQALVSKTIAQMQSGAYA